MPFLSVYWLLMCDGYLWYAGGIMYVVICSINILLVERLQYSFHVMV